MATSSTSTKDKGGRPSKLTPAVTAKICRFMENGLIFTRACILAGVSPRTALTWKKKGREEETGDYRQFLRAVKKAEVTFEAFHLQNVIRASQTSWAASMTLLERRWPSRYGQRMRNDINVTKTQKPRSLVLVRHGENGKGNVVAFAKAGGNGGSAST